MILEWNDPQPATLKDIPPDLLRAIAEPARKRVGQPETTPQETARHYLESDFVAPPSEDVTFDLAGDIANLFDPAWHAGKAIAKMAAKNAVEGLGAGAAGMIRMGGKEYPNAFLHRAIGKPRELDWLTEMFEQGGKTEKPTTAVTPSVLGTFKNEPYGVLFDVTDPKQIRRAYARDVSSYPYEGPFWSKQAKLRSDEITDLLSGQYEPLTKAYSSGRISADEYVERKAPLDELFRERQALSNNYRMESWRPDRREERFAIDPSKQGLEDLFLGPKAELARRLDEDTPVFGANEIVARIEPNMLKGIRLPLGEAAPNMDKRWLYNRAALEDSLLDFADRWRLPTFRWPGNVAPGSQAAGLSDPFRGKWGYPPGRRDYITSNQLPRLFGITELP
jgi:hypothetical protein